MTINKGTNHELSNEPQYCRVGGVAASKSIGTQSNRVVGHGGVGGDVRSQVLGGAAEPDLARNDGRRK